MNFFSNIFKHIKKRKKVFVSLDLNNPIVAWEVYRGNIISCENISDKSFDASSLWYVEYMKKYLQGKGLAYVETLLETVRQQKFNDKTSRLKGIYAFSSSAIAKNALDLWGKKGLIVEAYLGDVKNITKVDSKWITFFHQHENDNSWMDKYWSGQPYDSDPHWELLISGRLKIMDSAVIEKAREKIVSLWPKSIHLLELSRIAASLGSDMGHIVPIILHNKDNSFSLEYIIDMRDAKNQDYLKKLKAYVEKKEGRVFGDKEIETIVPELKNQTFNFIEDNMGGIRLMSK